VWFASQLTGGDPVYHVADEVAVRYRLSAQDVLAALACCCERHETLRTSFCLRDGALMQAVHSHIDLKVDQLDLSWLTEEEQRRRITELFEQLVGMPIPLDQPPLWRAALVRRGTASWVLLFVAHHAVFDAGSVLNLRAELTELCAAAAQARPASLPELRVQYADYAVWQRDQLAAGRLDELLAFWRAALADLPAVHGLPTDLPRPVERSFAGNDLIFPLPDGAERAAASVARQACATPFMVMFAAYAALLHHLCRSDDIVIGLPVAGRDRPELQPLIGMFVNMVVVRVDVRGNPAFSELLGRVRHALLDAWDHQEMPFQKLVEVLAERRDAGLPPLYQIGFNYLSIGFSRASAAAEDDLMLEVSNGYGRLEYSTALFTEQTARRIADGYVRVLRAVTADPHVPMSELATEARPEQPAGAMPGQQPDRMAVRSGNPPEPPAQAGRPAYQPPRTAAEELVARVWSEVLGQDQVGALDAFFHLGGHSLLALRVIARLSAAAGIELPIQSFFINTTLAGVAAELERMLTAELNQKPDEEAARLLAGEG